MTDPGPSRTGVFLDEREDSINDGYFVIDMGGYPDQPAQWRSAWLHPRPQPHSTRHGNGSILRHSSLHPRRVDAGAVQTASSLSDLENTTLTNDVQTILIFFARVFRWSKTPDFG
jgi:hypothetical protein